MGEPQQQKHIQHPPSTAILLVVNWLDWKVITHAKISPKMVNARYIAGNAEDEAAPYQGSLLQYNNT